MSGFGSVILDPSLAAAGTALVVGFAALWANTRRPVNRAFFSASLHVALWLALIYCAVQANEGLRWVRMATAVGAFFPLQLWFIRDAICNGFTLRQLLKRRRVWVGLAIVLAILPFTHWFIPAHSTSAQKLYGPGYYAYIVGISLTYLVVAFATVHALRSQNGVKRIELRIVLVGGCIAGLAIIVLMILRTVLGLPWLIGLQPFVILVFYVGMVIAITTSRVFNARQILLLGFKHLVLIGVVTLSAYALDQILSLWLRDYLALFTTVGLVLWIAARVERQLDLWFHFYPEADVARQAAHEISQRESRVDRLEQAFAGILKGWAHTDRCLLLQRAKAQPTTSPIGGADEELWAAMRVLHWATPERLARERSTPSRALVASYLRAQQMGVLIFAEGPAVTMLIGTGDSRRPYTYPEVTQLLELGSIIAGAFERAHLAAKVQHAEQLATVGMLGASVAHEIRNPLVTIKTFVQLLPTHYQNDHFRQKFVGLIADEVDRIDRLTEQLLELAAPRTYVSDHVALHPILRGCLDLVSTKAAHLNVRLDSDFAATPDTVFTDAAAAKQVVLNLCFNAMQALENHGAEARAIAVATRNVNGSVEVAVTDNGPGIAAEVYPRLFQPFQTTKSSGFGLGLAICSDILTNLNASISVDAPVAGRGATFRVLFPCPPSSS